MLFLIHKKIKILYKLQEIQTVEKMSYLEFTFWRSLNKG